MFYRKGPVPRAYLYLRAWNTVCVYMLVQDVAGGDGSNLAFVVEEKCTARIG